MNPYEFSSHSPNIDFWQGDATTLSRQCKIFARTRNAMLPFEEARNRRRLRQAGASDLHQSVSSARGHLKIIG
jgi:hypothetical protein